MRNINNKLRKNYRILSEHNFEGKTKVNRHKLLSAGFDFDFITQIVTYKNGAQYFFVYEQGYKILDSDWVLLVKKTTE